MKETSQSQLQRCYALLKLKCERDDNNSRKKAVKKYIEKGTKWLQNNLCYTSASELKTTLLTVLALGNVFQLETFSGNLVNFNLLPGRKRVRVRNKIIFSNKRSVLRQ